MDEMYKDHILQLWKDPDNFRRIDGALERRGFNAGCGDDIVVYLKIENDEIADASFTGSACALCTASASLLTDNFKGKKKAHIEQMSSQDINQLLGIQVTPPRLKCVLLPLETAKKIIKESEQDARD